MSSLNPLCLTGALKLIRGVIALKDDFYCRDIVKHGALDKVGAFDFHYCFLLWLTDIWDAFCWLWFVHLITVYFKFQVKICSLQVVACFVANGPRYNLLNSAIIEFFDYMRQVGVLFYSVNSGIWNANSVQVVNDEKCWITESMSGRVCLWFANFNDVPWSW